MEETPVETRLSKCLVAGVGSCRSGGWCYLVTFCLDITLSHFPDNNRYWANGDDRPHLILMAKRTSTPKEAHWRALFCAVGGINW